MFISEISILATVSNTCVRYNQANQLILNPVAFQKMSFMVKCSEVVELEIQQMNEIVALC